MGKGRILTNSRSERYLGNLGSDNGEETANGSSELVEDDVWSMADGTDNGVNHSYAGGWSSHASMEGSRSFRIDRSHRPRPPPHHHQVGGLSLAFDHSGSNSSSPRILHQFRSQDSAVESPRGRQMATSAPVNVPDWSKIYRADSVESMHEMDDAYNDCDDSDHIVPPHEYLARSRRNVANSVFEGAGRTLKGRDLSRVRDAVWSQTGFDG